MGLINHDPISLPWNSSTTVDTYYHIGTGSPYIRRNEDGSFQISLTYEIHYDHQARVDRKPAIGLHSINLSNVPLATIETVPVFTILYNQLKLEVPNHTDF